MEEELGIDIFVRHGKRLRRVTEPGLKVLEAIDVILREVGNLKRIGDEYAMQDAWHPCRLPPPHASPLRAA